MPQSKIIIGRTRVCKDIICEFAQPNTKSNKAIILIPGLPALPGKTKLLEYFSTRGYWSFLPRLRGTWESGGKFLEESPEEDYKLLISSIQDSFADSWSKAIYKPKFKQIDIIGASFGGTAAVLLSRLKSVRKAVALSPVIDWAIEGQEKTHEKFREYLKDGFGMAYRGSNSRLKQLLRGDFYNPVDQTGFDPNKLLIIQTLDDLVVPAQPAIDFCATHNVKHKFFKKGGHLGLSDCARGKYKKIVDEFLNTRR